MIGDNRYLGFIDAPEEAPSFLSHRLYSVTSCGTVQPVSPKWIQGCFSGPA